MDVLSDVLRSVRLCGSVFFTAEFSSPWALDSPNPELLATIVMPEADHVSLFHILMEGQCVVECDRYPRVAMESGDVVVFPHGHAHTMRSEDSADPTPLDHVLSRPSPDALPNVSLGGGGRSTRFICGYLNCNQRFAPLFEALPSILIVRRRTDYGTVEAIDGTPRESADVPQESSTWLATTLKFTVNEALAARPGNAAMLGRLTELMFVEITREYMQQLNPREWGWLAALQDPYVGKALRLLHENPMRPWTVDGLAHDVAISRSGLAQRFTRLLGESPMKYCPSGEFIWRSRCCVIVKTTSKPSPSVSATNHSRRSTARSRRPQALRRPSGAGPPLTSLGSTETPVRREEDRPLRGPRARLAGPCYKAGNVTPKRRHNSGTLSNRISSEYF